VKEESMSPITIMRSTLVLLFFFIQQAIGWQDLMVTRTTADFSIEYFFNWVNIFSYIKSSIKYQHKVIVQSKIKKMILLMLLSKLIKLWAIKISMKLFLQQSYYLIVVKYRNNNWKFYVIVLQYFTSKNLLERFLCHKLQREHWNNHLKICY